MSVDKWSYDPEKCDSALCVGDCDHCKLAIVADEEEDKEQDMSKTEIIQVIQKGIDTLIKLEEPWELTTSDWREVQMAFDDMSEWFLNKEEDDG